MLNFTDPDNKVFGFFGKICDLILVNLLTILCSLPVFTIGAAFTAAYSVSMKIVKDSLSYTVKSYFQAFKDNFKKATLLWLIELAAIVLVVFDIYFLSGMNSSGFVVICLYLVYMLAFVTACVFISLFPLTAKFEHTVRETIRNALLLSIKHLPWTIILLLIWAAPWLPLLIYPVSILKFIIPFMLLFGFGIEFFLSSLIMNHIFKRYIPEDVPKEKEDKGA